MFEVGITVIREPKHAPCGLAAVFEDLPGNLSGLVPFTDGRS